MTQSIMTADAILVNIGDATSKQEILDVLAQLNMVKEALKAADRFREESVKFARYEAYALVRVMEISGDSSLIKGKWRKATAEWLAGMTQDKRDEYIAMCSDGKTIDNIYRELIAIPQQRNELAQAVAECKSIARKELKESGIVVVPRIVREHSNRFPKSMMREITDGVRSAVRDAGGVGIGDDNGTYIDPDKESNYISDAIATRISAVVRDVEGIADLANRCESKPTFYIKGDGTRLSFADVTYLIMAGVGAAEVRFDTGGARKAATAMLRRIAGDVA